MEPFVIREFASHEDRAKCVELQELTWGRGFTEKVPAAMLLVAQKTGGVVAGAFDPDDRLLGYVFGITGLRNGKLMHWSDMLAVHPDARGLDIGVRLKAYQRDRCREMGIDTIYWTFDPLAARNAHLNLNKMGARVDEYVVAMYGEATNSPLQGDMPTDRFVLAWSVDPAATAPRLAALPADLQLAVGDDANEGPLVNAKDVGIRIPRDITALAAADLGAARRWRFATRRAFTHYLPRGYRVTGFVSDATGGTYLLAMA